MATICIGIAGRKNSGENPRKIWPSRCVKRIKSKNKYIQHLKTIWNCGLVVWWNVHYVAANLVVHSVAFLLINSNDSDRVIGITPCFPTIQPNLVTGLRIRVYLVDYKWMPFDNIVYRRCCAIPWTIRDGCQGMRLCTIHLLYGEENLKKTFHFDSFVKTVWEMRKYPGLGLGAVAYRKWWVHGEIWWILLCWNDKYHLDCSSDQCICVYQIGQWGVCDKGRQFRYDTLQSGRYPPCTEQRVS
jgi:hypothetical protein